MILCVYALAPRGAGTRLSTPGLSGERLRAVGDGPVIAVAGELARAPRPSSENLRKYDAAIRSLAARLPALLPARYGTCFDSVDELTFVLRARERTMRTALAHVRNRVQMTVRVVGPAAASAKATAPGGRSRATGAEHLRGLAADAARAREIPGFDPVRAVVRRWVRDERVEKKSGVASVYHLVPRGSADAYRRAVERAAAAADLRVVVSGPWPPYAFAEL